MFMMMALYHEPHWGYPLQGSCNSKERKDSRRQLTMSLVEPTTTRRKRNKTQLPQRLAFLYLELQSC